MTNKTNRGVVYESCCEIKESFKTSGVICRVALVMCLGLYNGRCSGKSISLCMQQQQFTFRASKNGILKKN